jgi:hypothetical protein
LQRGQFENGILLHLYLYCRGIQTVCLGNHEIWRREPVKEQETIIIVQNFRGVQCDLKVKDAVLLDHSKHHKKFEDSVFLRNYYVFQYFFKVKYTN